MLPQTGELEIDPDERLEREAEELRFGPAYCTRR